MTAVYDLCIVGAGLIGSAAARHASRYPGVKVVLVGVPEIERRPDDHGVYGAFHDEGRITRSSDPDPVWAKLAQESIQRYRHIEQESGIPFYRPVGHMSVGTRNNEYITSVEQVAKQQSVDVQCLRSSMLQKNFPYLKFGANDRAVLEVQNSGHISPRSLVRAQKLLAKRHGCRVMDAVVNHVEKVSQSDGTDLMRVTTMDGHSIISRRVLLATGAFIDYHPLLPEVKLDQIIWPLTVSLVEVNQKYAAQLRDMPTVIYRGDGHPEWTDIPRYDDNSTSFYLLPPIKYPDGKYYIKLGHFGGSLNESLDSPAEIKRWFREGNVERARETAVFIESLFKGLKLGRWKADFCGVVKTPTNHPYIDLVHPLLGVATGGNGSAAKSSDEIGRLGAAMMLKGWDSDLPWENFKMKLITGAGKPTVTKSML